DLGSMMESLMNEGYRCYSLKNDFGFSFECWGDLESGLPDKYMSIRDKCPEPEESGNDAGTDDANTGTDDANTGTDNANTGTDDANAETDDANAGTDNANAGTDGANAGADNNS
ncbi:MAG: hypothetical protein OXB84_08755, partial [Halobacteriovoraceae bacterium]|nr:hypothetical protein [Halobacteriovoraceae bacterium]